MGGEREREIKKKHFYFHDRFKGRENLKYIYIYIFTTCFRRENKEFFIFTTVF